MLRHTFLLLWVFVFMHGALLHANETSSQAWAEFHGQRFYVEIAADGPTQAQGLMWRRHMDPDKGMLFVYPNAQPRQFWMKNTFIPLDIIYLDNQFRVVAISAGAQPCRSTPCPTYPSRVPAKYVLEINAGLAHAFGLGVGDEIQVFLP